MTFILERFRKSNQYKEKKKKARSLIIHKVKININLAHPNVDNN